jgi:hypothetical protein
MRHIPHIAALAIVSWYLMLPPPGTMGDRIFYAPLSDWKLIDQFDSERACHEMRLKLIKRMPNTDIDFARCLSGDDFYPMPEPKPKVVG